MSACWPGMFADLTDKQVWDMLRAPLTACEETEIMNEAMRRKLFVQPEEVE